jgi:uncharacterized protein (TIGR02246 family)
MWRLGFCGLLIAIASPRVPTERPEPAQDVRAVHETVARYVQARNAKNADAVRELFTADSDQLVSTGEWRKGLNQIVRGTSASSRNEMSRSSITVENVRFLDADVALADGRYQTTALSGAVRNMWTTIILKRTPDGWRITAIRNMLPSQPTH